MNIYFTISFRGATKYQQQVKEIYDHLSNSKHTVAKRVFKMSTDSLENEEIGTENILNFSNAELPDVYKTILKRIREADVVIADTSVPSSSVGYEIAMAQSEKKPILVLHNNDSLAYLADVIGGNTSKSLHVVKYGNTQEALKGIDDFIAKAREAIDTKFILIISPKIDRYLEWAAEERRQHKAQIVRDSIETVMEKDKEYQQYLKEENF